MVDLAGSERLENVGFDRINETCHINTSLFTLSKVIKKLAEHKKYSLSFNNFRTHVPFRESKLTQLIKNSLGGNSMTSIICTISPHKDHLPLSLQTLEFAKRAKSIKNSAMVNEVVDNHDLIQKYQKVSDPE